MSNLEQYKVDVPEGVAGDWSVERFEVTEEGASFHNLRCAFQPRSCGREIEPGMYTKLQRGRHLVMSDTPAEISDHFEPIQRAAGRVLIHGLGLGMVARACLEKQEVEHVTVVELSEDVIGLCGPSLTQQYGDRVSIICADALTWKPPKGSWWNVVWHDIWDDICTDNLPDMRTLHRRYGSRSGWQGSWARELLSN